MNRFEQRIASHNLVLQRGAFQTLQINVGRKCNQTCTHCHVDAGPTRTEMMDEKTAHRVGAWILEHRPKTMDITGGAPEISEFFRYFVETARSVGPPVIDRNNLTIIETKTHAYLPEYLARHGVEVVASLPCYLEDNVDSQRGNGVFQKSISALKKLNDVGDEGEVFDCDFNPMLHMHQRNDKPLYLWDVTPESMAFQSILTANHCFGCTAGAGSSCSGTLEHASNS